jgi:hypothetical protein
MRRLKITNANKINLEDHYNLVHEILKKFPSANPDNYNDLFNSGIIGMARAAQTYDPSKSKFSTHSYFFIFKSIQTQIALMRDPAISYGNLWSLKKYHRSSLSMDYTYESDGAGKSTLHDFLSIEESPDTNERNAAIIKLSKCISKDIGFVDWIFNDVRYFTKAENKTYTRMIKKYYAGKSSAIICIRLKLRKIIKSDPTLREYFSSYLNRGKRRIYKNKSYELYKKHDTYVASLKDNN